MAPALPTSTTASRSAKLMASRILADFHTAVHAAERIGFKTSTYRTAEEGLRNASRTLIASASGAFGVSEEFLENGQVNSEKDGYAARAAERIDRYRKWVQDPGNAQVIAATGARLSEAREHWSHYRSASAAAKTCGLVPSSYIAAESGARPIPVGKLILYAAKLDCNYDYLLFGESSPKPASIDQAWRPAAFTQPTPDIESSKPEAGFDDAADDVGWEWLNHTWVWEGRQAVPILRPGSGGTLEPMPNGSLVLPGALRLDRDGLFAVCIGDRSPKLTLYRRTSSVTTHTAYWNGRSVVRRARSGAIAVDPTGVPATADRPIVLGDEVGSLELR